MNAVNSPWCASLVAPRTARHASPGVALFAQALLVVALAWGAFAFGAVYPWAYWPLIAAVLTVSLIGLAVRAHDRATPAGLIALSAGLSLFVMAGLLQLVPMPLTRMTLLSPEATRAITQLDLGVAAGARWHPLSIAPALTGIGLVLFASNALLVLGCARLLSMRSARRIAEGIAAVGVAVALAGIIQKPLFNGKIYGFWTTLDGGRPFGPFVNPNHFAGWMLMALPVTLGLLFGGIAQGMHGVKPNLRGRLLWLASAEASRLMLLAAGVMVMALSLVLTLSRSGIAALALAVVITGGFVARRQQSGRRAVAIAYLLVLVVAVVGWAGADAVASRFAQSDWSQLNNRRGAWTDAVDIASRFPATGTGLNTYRVATLLYQRHDLSMYYSQAHNDYLQLAAEGGLLLTVPAALCLGLLILAVRRRFVDETSTATYWLRVGAVTGLTAIGLQETVDFSLQMPGNAALFAVLCAIALHRTPERRTA
jgi:O-antigen ligase